MLCIFTRVSLGLMPVGFIMLSGAEYTSRGETRIDIGVGDHVMVSEEFAIETLGRGEREPVYVSRQPPWPQLLSICPYTLFWETFSLKKRFFIDPSIIFDEPFSINTRKRTS